MYAEIQIIEELGMSIVNYKNLIIKEQPEFCNNSISMQRATNEIKENVNQLNMQLGQSDPKNCRIKQGIFYK